MKQRNYEENIAMKERKEVLDYGMTLADVYIDTPFHDDNWVLLRYKRTSGLLPGLTNEMGKYG